MRLKPTLAQRDYPFLLLLLLIPVFAAFFWGSYFQDEVYSTLRYAQNLAFGRGLVYDVGIAGQNPPQSPLYILLLALLAQVAAIDKAALFLSALGWGVTATIIYLTSRSWNHKAAALAAILIVFSPLMTSTLGNPISWAIACGWLAIWLSICNQDDRLFILALMAMLLIWFDFATLALVGLVLFWRWRNKRRISGYLLLVVGIGILGWAIFMTLEFGRPFDMLLFSRLHDAFRPFQMSELYWLMLPLTTLGLVGVLGYYAPTIKIPPGLRQQESGEEAQFNLLILSWALIAGLSASIAASPIVSFVFLYLAGVGLAMIWEWYASRHNPAMAPAMILTALVCLLAIQVFVAWRSYEDRPRVEGELEAQVIAWLKENTTPETTLATSRRLGYLADRPTTPANPQAREPGQLADLLEMLIQTQPDVFVTGRDLGWQGLTGSGWFESRYQSVARFASDYAPGNAMDIWTYRSSGFDAAQIQPANVTIGENIRLQGYAFEPSIIQPGEDIYLTLYLQPTRPITVGFSTDVYLRYMQDGHVWAWNQHLTPKAVSGQFWQPGQVVPERIKLQTEENIPYGAYELQILWRWPDREDKWALYQDNDTNPLDRIRLGYAVAPPPAEPVEMQPVGATFSDQIRLAGLDIGGDLRPGGNANLTLFWEALRPPDDKYTVFVHLLNAEGELVAAHDGEPADGTFATTAWQPGLLVEDDHQLSLPTDMPPGDYDLRVGLYLLETGARLPAQDGQGKAYPDGALPLPAIEINR